MDDRREVFNIIKDYMTEREREAFLTWACRRVNTPLANVLKPGKGSTFHEKEVYWQVMSLITMHGADPTELFNKLVEFAKKGKLSLTGN